MSAVILKLVSFSLFDQYDSDKPEMIYIVGLLFNPSDRDKPEKINMSAVTYDH